MGARVAVAGASGYAGGELLRLLTGHPDLEIGPLAANSSAGLLVTAAHPQLTGYPGLDDAVFVGPDPDVLADADLLFTALPHGESAQLAARLPDHLRVIDLGADFRLADPGAWERYYPTPYAGQWTYGLPELPGARDAIKAAPRVAAPGCYATASILALAPLARGILATCTARLMEPAAAGSGTGPLRAALRAAYEAEPFVHVLPEGRWPATGATLGSNAAHLQVAADPHAGRAIVICALDNLVKGAAGQAIQIANLMLGLPETAGLTKPGVSP